MANFCYSCGSSVDPNALFCPVCGAALNGTAQNGNQYQQPVQSAPPVNDAGSTMGSILGTLVAVNLIGGLTRQLYYYGGRYYLDPYCRRPFMDMHMIRGGHRPIHRPPPPPPVGRPPVIGRPPIGRPPVGGPRPGGPHHGPVGPRPGGPGPRPGGGPRRGGGPGGPR